MAWDYPQGDYENLFQQLRDVTLGTRLSANRFSPGLGDFIFGVSFAIDSVDVGAPVPVMVHVTLDRNNAVVHLEICDSSFTCSKFDVYIDHGAVTKLEYRGTFDNSQMMLPSQSGATPDSCCNGIGASAPTPTTSRRCCATERRSPCLHDPDAAARSISD